MTDAVIQARSSRLIATWREAMKGEGEAWLYVFKGLIAILGSGGVAMALSLPSPTVAMCTALIVMNPKSGLVLAKSFYRITGTLVGVAVAVFMVGLFPQSQVFLLAAIAIWTASCAAGASIIRGFRGYGFLLAGYTAAMIILPVVNDPARIFSQAEARFFEVIIGILVSTLVFEGLFPRRLTPVVLAQGKKTLDFLKGSIVTGLSFDAQGGPDRVAAARNADDLENLVTHGMFEGPWVSRVSRPLRRSNHAFMQASTRLHAWHRLGERLNAQGHTDMARRLQDLAAPLRARLAQDGGDDGERLIADLRLIGKDIVAATETLAPTLDHRSRQTLITGAALLRRIAKALLRVQQAQLLIESGRDQSETSAPPSFVRTFDPVTGILTFVRTFVVCVVFGLLWIGNVLGTSGTAMFIVITLTSMLAPAPKPLVAVKFAALGHCIAPFLGLVCFSIMPLLTTFPLFALGLAPFVMICLYVSTRPGLAGLGMPMGIGLLVALSIGQTVSLDTTLYLNEAVATIVGVLLVSVGFMVLPGPAGKKSQIRRYRRMLDRSVLIAGTAPVRGLSGKVESRNRDLGLQLMAQQDPKSSAMGAYLAHAAAVQEACYVLVSLREAVHRPEVAPHIRQSVDEAVRAAVAAWPPETATPAACQHRDEQLRRALDVVPEGPPISRERELLLLLADALVELDQNREPV